MCENAKIAKVAALQQVQYKVLRYGLYAPIETWVSTPVYRLCLLPAMFTDPFTCD